MKQYIERDEAIAKMLSSCEDSSTYYLEIEGNLRLIFRDGEYVGWYQP